MKYALRALYPLVLGALSVVAWAVLCGYLSGDSMWAVIAIAMTIAWILPASVMIDHCYRTHSVRPIDAFGFKLICYVFGVPLVVMWVNALLFYLGAR